MPDMKMPDNAAHIEGASSPTCLSLDGISHQYGERWVLDSVSLDIKAGEIVSILGGSGSGKSTLLRLICGLEPPSAGTVQLNGIPQNGVPGAGTDFVKPEERSVGLVFQDFALFPHLTVLENVCFGVGKNETERVTKLLKAVGMDHISDQYPAFLSGGEKQRVAVARALAPGPHLMLLDEPFSGLDTQLRASVRAETLSILRNESTTAVIVTHDPSEAMAISDRVAVFDNGKLLQIDTPTNVYNAPVNKFVAQFFSSLTSFRSTSETGKIATPVGSIENSEFDEGEAVDVCFRPEMMALTNQSDVSGRVKAMSFSGDTVLLDVALDYNDQAARLRVPVSEVPALESVVYLQKTSAKPLVFRAKTH